MSKSGDFLKCQLFSCELMRTYDDYDDYSKCHAAYIEELPKLTNTRVLVKVLGQLLDSKNTR